MLENGVGANYWGNFTCRKNFDFETSQFMEVVTLKKTVLHSLLPESKSMCKSLVVPVCIRRCVITQCSHYVRLVSNLGRVPVGLVVLKNNRQFPSFGLDKENGLVDQFMRLQLDPRTVKIVT